MSLGADVIAMMRRAGVVVSFGGVTGVGLFDVAGRVSIRSDAGALVGRLIQVRTPTAQLPGITSASVLVVDGTEYVVHKVLQEHEGAVTLSLVAEKDGGPPTLTAEDLDNGRWRFSATSPSDAINLATVTAPDPGEGTVQLLCHDGSPLEREVVIVATTASSFDVQHGEQGAGDYEFVIDGVTTPGGIPYVALSQRFTIA